MTKTTNYQLNQWAASDPIRRADFNADNAAIDAAIKAAEQNAANALAAYKKTTDAAVETIPAFSSGSYIGTGTSGSANPNSLVFPFSPKIVFIVAESYSAVTDMFYFGTVLLAGQTKSNGIGGAYNIAGGTHLQVSWAGNTVSWYSRQNNVQNLPSAQMNMADITYYYLAIG